MRFTPVLAGALLAVALLPATPMLLAQEEPAEPTAAEKAAAPRSPEEI